MFYVCIKFKIVDFSSYSLWSFHGLEALELRRKLGLQDLARFEAKDCYDLWAYIDISETEGRKYPNIFQKQQQFYIELDISNLKRGMVVEEKNTGLVSINREYDFKPLVIELLDKTEQEIVWNSLPFYKKIANYLGWKQ